MVLLAGDKAAAGECRFIEAAAAARSLPVCTRLWCDGEELCDCCRLISESTGA